MQRRFPEKACCVLVAYSVCSDAAGEVHLLVRRGGQREGGCDHELQADDRFSAWHCYCLAFRNCVFNHASYACALNIGRLVARSCAFSEITCLVHVSLSPIRHENVSVVRKFKSGYCQDTWSYSLRQARRSNLNDSFPIVSVGNSSNLSSASYTSRPDLSSLVLMFQT